MEKNRLHSPVVVLGGRPYDTFEKAIAATKISKYAVEHWRDAHPGMSFGEALQEIYNYEHPQFVSDELKFVYLDNLFDKPINWGRYSQSQIKEILRPDASALVLLINNKVALTINEVAVAAGLSRQTIYNWFHDQIEGCSRGEYVWSKLTKRGIKVKIIRTRHLDSVSFEISDIKVPKEVQIELIRFRVMSYEEQQKELSRLNEETEIDIATAKISSGPYEFENVDELSRIAHVRADEILYLVYKMKIGWDAAIEYSKISFTV